MKKLIILLIVLVSFGLLFGCTNTNVDDSNNTAEGRVVFALTDAAADMGSVTSINATVDSVQVYNSTKGWVTVSTQPRTYDLLELKAEGKTVVLADIQLETGSYDKVRLNLSKIVVVDADGEKTAAIPNNQIEINATVKINENGDSIATFDVIADESLHVSTEGDYVFAPVVEVTTKSNTEVSIQSNGNVLATGGTTDTSTKVGMDLEGNVGVGISISSTTEISTIVDGLGNVKIDVGIGINTSSNNQNDTEDEDTMEQEETNNSVVFEEFVATISQMSNYKVTYNFSSSGQSYTMTQFNYNGEMRSDVTTQGVESRTYILLSGITTCTNMSGWMCFDASGQVESSFNAGFEDAKTNPEKYRQKVTSAGTKTIIGQSTTCYNVVDDDYAYIYCLNSNGVPLSIEGVSSGNEFSYIATEYTTSVSASDLVLPASSSEFNYPGMQ